MTVRAITPIVVTPIAIQVFTRALACSTRFWAGFAHVIPVVGVIAVPGVCDTIAVPGVFTAPAFRCKKRRDYLLFIYSLRPLNK